MIPVRLLNQSCHIARHTGEHSILGEETHSEPSEYKCRIDYDTKLVYNISGTEVPSIATVYVDTDVSEHDIIYLDSHFIETSFFDLCRYNLLSFNVGDTTKETLPQLIVGSARKPLAVKHLYDGAGNFSHCEVAI